VTNSHYFTWDVDRVIFTIYEPFGLRWYSLFFLSGILLGSYLLGKMLEHNHKPIYLRDTILYYAVIGIIVGARLGHCLFYDPGYYLSHPLRILQIWEGGLASHGGYSGLVLAIYIFSRRYRELNFWWLMDRIAFLAVLGGAFIRMGNFFNSEIVGLPSTLPWAVIFPQHDMIPRHPTQLYEALGYALISAILYAYYLSKDRRPLSGSVFGLAMAIAFTFRFFIEGFKENQVPAIEDGLLFNLGQLLSIPFVVVGLVIYGIAVTRNKGGQPDPATTKVQPKKKHVFKC
jgi:prolipoprotein diacylglyceryl transferase